MKPKFLLFLLVAAAAAAPGADTVPIGGKWEIHITVADHEADDTCTFTQDGKDLAGSCTSERGTGKLSGKIDDKDDKKITWTCSVGGITLTYRGTLSKAADMTGFMAGSVTVEEYGVVGEFTGTQST